MALYINAVGLVKSFLLKWKFFDASTKKEKKEGERKDYCHAANLYENPRNRKSLK